MSKKQQENNMLICGVMKGAHSVFLSFCCVTLSSSACMCEIKRQYVCSAPSSHVTLWSITVLGASYHDSQSHDERAHHRCVSQHRNLEVWPCQKHTHTHTHTQTVKQLSFSFNSELMHTQTHLLYAQTLKKSVLDSLLSLSLTHSHSHTHTHTHTQPMRMHNTHT